MIMKKILHRAFSLGHPRKYCSNTLAHKKIQTSKEDKGSLIISCKRSHLDHFSAIHYNKFDVVPLASKGWNHSKSKGDFFIVHPFNDNSMEITYSLSELELPAVIVETLKSEGIRTVTNFQYRASEAMKTGI